MTKERLRRLMELEYLHSEGDEYKLLAAEFDAWEPDRERDEARAVARSFRRQLRRLRFLDEETTQMVMDQDERRFPWLVEAQT